MTNEELKAVYGKEVSAKEHDANLAESAKKSKVILENFVKKTLSSKEK